LRNLRFQELQLMRILQTKQREKFTTKQDKNDAAAAQNSDIVSERSELRIERLLFAIEVVGQFADALFELFDARRVLRRVRVELRLELFLCIVQII
jgi:hypothetical protein